MNLKITGKVFTSKFVAAGPSSYEKKNLPGRGLTKVEKHWSRPTLQSSVNDPCRLHDTGPCTASSNPSQGRARTDNTV